MPGGLLVKYCIYIKRNEGAYAEDHKMKIFYTEILHLTIYSMNMVNRSGIM